MKFSLPTIAVAALSCCNPVLGALTASQIVDNINTLTAISQDLQGAAQTINILSGPLLLLGQGPFPTIITGLSKIVSTATVYLPQMQGTLPITATADATTIYNAFREFVRVHQVLLNILIGKAGLLETLPLVGQPVSAALRQIESVVDTIAIDLINVVQSRATDLQNQLGSLDMTLDNAIKSYGGLNLNKRNALDTRSASFRALRV